MGLVSQRDGFRFRDSSSLYTQKSLLSTLKAAIFVFFTSSPVLPACRGIGCPCRRIRTEGKPVSEKERL